MIGTTHKNYANRLFWLSILLCTVYQSYRYPLQINSTGTSPTYSDTPLWLQIAKFALAVPLLIGACLRCLDLKLSYKRWLIVVSVLILAGTCGAKMLDGESTSYLDAGFWMLFPLIVVLASDPIDVSSIDRYLFFLLAYSLLSNFIEIILFLTIGRLPALAYEGSFFVRFGGFLDDPNGFAAILFLLLGWVYRKFRGLARVLAIFGILISLVLTQSWTGILFLMAVLFCWLSTKALKRPFLAMPLCCMILLGSAFLLWYFPPNGKDFLYGMMITKQGSLQDHSIPLDKLGSQFTQWLLIGSSSYTAYESWWGGAPLNWGLPWVCMHAVLTTYLVYRLGISLKRCDALSKPVLSGFFLFGCYFEFGSFNLPFPIIFPINALFYLFSFLIVFERVALTDPSESPVDRPYPSLPCDIGGRIV